MKLNDLVNKVNDEFWPESLDKPQEKQTYAEFLNESEVFADWLKQIPFNFDLKGLKVNKDNSVTMVFKNSLDTDRFKPMS